MFSRPHPRPHSVAAHPRRLRQFPLFVLALAASALVPALSPDAAAGTVEIKERLAIAPVWSGHPVNFALLTEGERQYVGYYDEQRRMTVACRKLGSSAWTTQTLPSSVGWDSHNYITLAFDREGQLHVVGNLHVTPLVYFRTEKPGDVTSLVRVARMTGQRESRMTYPQFIKDAHGGLVFTYRDGESGDGSTIYNRYDEKKRAWTRLLDRPLFDGEGARNAYPVGPVYGPDGYWHMTWLWRDGRDAETNHTLCHARSRDLSAWENAAGKPIRLPITFGLAGVVVDPVPVEGGIINGSGKIGFDQRKQPVISYHKFDDKGATQVYLARFENDAWRSRCITEWTHRWEPRGPGSIPFEVTASELQSAPGLGHFIVLANKVHGHQAVKIDPSSLRPLDRIRGDQLPDYVPPGLLGAPASGLVLKTTRDLNASRPGTRYLLRWETLPLNRDRPRDGPPPPPSQLELIGLSDSR